MATSSWWASPTSSELARGEGVVGGLELVEHRALAARQGRRRPDGEQVSSGVRSWSPRRVGRRVVVVVSSGGTVVVVVSSGGPSSWSCLPAARRRGRRLFGRRVVVVVSSGGAVVVVGSVAGTVVVVGLGSAASAGTAASVRDAVDRTAASTSTRAGRRASTSARITVTLVKMLFLARPIARVRPIAHCGDPHNLSTTTAPVSSEPKDCVPRSALQSAASDIRDNPLAPGPRRHGIDDSGYRSVRAPSRPRKTVALKSGVTSRAMR